MNLINFTIPNLYNSSQIVNKDSLVKIKDTVDWEQFRPILDKMYSNKKGVGGRPNYDSVMMLKILFLASINNLTDEQTEILINDRISYRMFLGNPDKLPDQSTIWSFRERMDEYNISSEIWENLMKQIEQKGVKISKGCAQDATFIEADPGHKKADTPRGDEAKTRRSRDGTFAKKYNESHYGYKLHTVVDTDNSIITKYDVTTANVHDSKIDLSEEGQIIYRDKGYCGTDTKGYNGTMKKGARNHPIGIRDELRNKRISKKRNCVERPYATIKRTFRGERTLVSTLNRVSIKACIMCLAYNIIHMVSLLNGTKTKKRNNKNTPGVARNTFELFATMSC